MTKKIKTCDFRITNHSRKCDHYIEGKIDGLGNELEAGFCRLPKEFRCIESLKHHLPRVSHSSRKSFIQCRMKYYYNQIEGRVLLPHRQTDAIKAGAIWDKFLELKHEGKPTKETIHKLFVKYKVSPVLEAKLTAIIKAYITLEIEHNEPNLVNCQHEFVYPIYDVITYGKIDRAYIESFTESKLTTNPDFHRKLHYLQAQLSTYFLSNENYKSCIVEIVKMHKGKPKANESVESFQKRLYHSYIARPKSVFLEYKEETKTFGYKFWRTEFDLPQILRTYEIVNRDISRAIKNNEWYRNDLACHVPTDCEYLHRCDTGSFSKMLYGYKDKH